MNKRIKKLVLGVAGVCMIMCSMVSVGAAYPTCADWSARRVRTPGAGAAADKTDRVNVAYSTKGAYVYCTSVSHTVNGAKGTISISCIGQSMPIMHIVDIGSAFCNPSVMGLVEKITYYITANTDKDYDVFNCSGQIVVIK